MKKRLLIGSFVNSRYVKIQLVQSKIMKIITLVSTIILGFVSISAQSGEARKIYETEKTFERAVAEKGINQGFIEFLTDDAVIFRPSAVNAKQYLKSQPFSPALLTWNPVFIDVASNGAIAYSTGNGMFRPKGKDDTNVFYSHYVSIWRREPDGTYKAVLDTGISHEKPERIETDWKSSNDSKDLNEKKLSAADFSTAFFETAEKQNLTKAYKMFLAEDARLLREGKMPFIGRKSALEEIKNNKSKIKFVKRSVFTGAADIAYFTNGYTLLDKDGKETEKGTFVQIWKLREGKWQIVLDIFNPVKR